MMINSCVTKISLFKMWHTDPKLDELFGFGNHCNGKLGQAGVFDFEKWLNDPGQQGWRCRWTPSVCPAACCLLLFAPVSLLRKVQPTPLSTSESQLVPRIVLKVMAKENRMKN